MIELISGPHLLVISDRRQVGTFVGGKPVWVVTAVKVLPCCTQSGHLNETQLDEDDRYIQLLKHFISVTGIYYSQEYDLTRSYQDQFEEKFVDLGKVRSKYFLNAFIAEPFIKAQRCKKDAQFDQFISVCIEGCKYIDGRLEVLMVLVVEIQPTNIHNERIHIGIVSRRATGRVGTRHFSRGIDQNGSVSNFVETEQIVYSSTFAGSFVQIRGSIPIYWRQNVNLFYKPPLELYNTAENEQVFKKHITDLTDTYKNVLAVNLVDRGGFEGVLAKKFAQHVDQLNNSDLKYVHFDFHQNCKKMQWHKISLLMDNIESELKNQGHFTVTLNPPKILCQQRGIVRTNCIDCLDRTNVVQSVIAQHILNEQLHEMSLYRPRETIQNHFDLLWFFKNCNPNLFYIYFHGCSVG